MLFIQPIYRLSSIGVGYNFLVAITDRSTLKIVGFTLWQAILSTAICLVIATPTAFLFYRRRFRLLKHLDVLITLPFILPSIVVGIGFSSLRSAPGFSIIFGQRSSIFLIVAANIFMNYGLATRIIGTVWESLGADLEEAAELDGAGRVKTFFSITFHQLRQAYLSAGFLIFLYCSANFALILVLGNERTKTVESAIYFSATQNLDFPRVSGLVLIQSLITIIGFTLSTRFSSNSVNPFSQAGEGSTKKVSKRDLPVLIFVGVTISILIAGPILSIILKAFNSEFGIGLHNFALLNSRGLRNTLNISVLQAAENSFRNAIVSTALIFGIGLTVAYLLSRPGGSRVQVNTSKILSVLFRLPIGISSVVLGLGYLLTFSSGFFPLRSSWLVTPIAQSIILIPLLLQIVLPALAAISPDLRESGEMDSATQSQFWWFVEIPLIRGALLVSLGYVLLVSLGEFGAANFLSYGDQATLPTVLYQLISRPGANNYGMAMAVSALTIVVSFFLLHGITTNFSGLTTSDVRHRRRHHRHKLHIGAQR